tara:strand:- start:96 stop:1592 length:1497 start_codon:yes stop_codon:yes gene_type:complete
MGKYDRGLDWEKMEEAQAPDYIPPKEELAGLPSVVQEQYEARAIPTVTTQNQAFTDFISDNQEAYTEIMKPPSQAAMDLQNELDAERERDRLINEEHRGATEEDNIFSDIFTNLGQAEQASSDAGQAFYETPEEELPEDIAQIRNTMEDVSSAALAMLLGVNVKSEVENIQQLGDAAQSFMDEVRADSATMTAEEYNEKYGSVVESPIDLEYLQEMYNIDVDPERLSFSQWVSQALGLPEYANNPIELQQSIETNLGRDVIFGSKELVGDWPSEYWVETPSGQLVVSGNKAREKIASGSATHPSLVAGNPPPEGVVQNEQLGIGSLTTKDIYSFVSMDKTAADADNPNDRYPYDKFEATRDDPDKLGYYETFLDPEGDNYQAGRVNMEVVKTGLVSNRPVAIVRVSDKYGRIPDKEVMVYVSSGKGAPDLKKEGDVIAITGFASDGRFEKIPEQVHMNFGSRIMNEATNLVKDLINEDYWIGEYYDKYKLLGDGPLFP